MFAICLESSHARGMGHLYRGLNLYEFMQTQNQPCLIVLNDHGPSRGLLENKGIPFEVADLEDLEGAWESELIRRRGIRVWINDRLDTVALHAQRVKSQGVTLVTFDDRGSGAGFSDLHFAPLIFKDQNRLAGRQVFTGPDYLILNSDIEACRRLRKGLERVVVSLGGSDTHGVTIQVVRIMKALGIRAEIHIGPSFGHRRELEEETRGIFPIIDSVASLIRAFAPFDLAVTGGGVTPFEANAAGLPCLVIANEDFEVPVGEFLHCNGSSRFISFHRELTYKGVSEAFAAAEKNLTFMSQRGLVSIPTNAVENIFGEICRAA